MLLICPKYLPTSLSGRVCGPKKIIKMYTCKNCDFSSTSWYGRCPECGEFNTLIETVQKKDKKKSSTYKKAILSPLSSFKSHDKTRIKTGIFEIDRVLGGGFVGGEVVLLAGEPGV